VIQVFKEKDLLHEVSKQFKKMPIKVYKRSHLNIIFNLLYKFRKHSFAVSPAQRDDDLPEKCRSQHVEVSTFFPSIQSWYTEHTHVHMCLQA